MTAMPTRVDLRLLEKTDEQDGAVNVDRSLEAMGDFA